MFDFKVNATETRNNGLRRLSAKNQRHIFPNLCSLRLREQTQHFLCIICRWQRLNWSYRSV